MQSLITCVTVRQRNCGRRPRMFKQYQAVMFAAIQLPSGKWVWRYSSSLDCWRHSEKAAWNDAADAARRNDLEVVVGIKAGDNVYQTLHTPDAAAGSNPQQSDAIGD